MAKGKSTGRVNTTKAGLFDTRAAAGATGLTRGAVSVNPNKSKVTTVNRRKYVSDQFSKGYS